MYVILFTFTQKRMENIKDLPKGLDKGRQLAQSLGIEITSLIYTLGQYDAVAIGEAPNDEAVAKWLLAYGSEGLMKTETLKGFTPDEFVRLISELP